MRPFLLFASGALLYIAWKHSYAITQDEGNVSPEPSISDTIAELSSSVSTLGGTNMQLSQAGLQAIMSREGFSATPYRDASGWSIGYGHFIQAGEAFSSITTDQAAALLAQDVQKAVNAVNGDVTVPLSQNQFDALVSLVYNIGVGAFARSTLLRLLNGGDYAGAMAQFAVWKLSNGQINPVLVSRRQDEANQFAA